MEEPNENNGHSPTKNDGENQSKKKEPNLEKVMEDDEFIPELRLKNEHLLKQ